MTQTIEMPGTVIPAAGDIKRRNFLVGGAATLLLVGCGGSGANGPSGETKSMEDGKGRSVEVPVDPRRVVVLDPGEVVFDLVELGFVPEGATTDATTVGGNFPGLLGEAGRDIEPVGDSLSPNLEKIATLEPDLIFHQTKFSDPGIEKLSGIAPTVQYDGASFGPDPAERVRFVARAVGREREAGKLIGRWEARLEEGAGKLDIGGETCAVVLLYAFEPSFDLYGPDYVTGHVAEKLGWSVVPKKVNGEPLEDYVAAVSLEQIGRYMEADTVLFLRFASGLTGGENESGENVSIVTDSEVWRAIPAVEQGRLIELDAMEARGGYGFKGLYRILDTIVREHELAKGAAS